MLRAAYAFRQFCNSRLGKYQRARDRHISRAHELRGAQAARTRLAREEKLGVADNDEQSANSSTSDWGGNEGWGTGEGWGSGKWYIDTAEATQCGRHQWEICPSLEITHGEEISPLLLPVHLGYPKIVPLHLNIILFWCKDTKKTQSNHRYGKAKCNESKTRPQKKKKKGRRRRRLQNNAKKEIEFYSSSEYRASLGPGTYTSRRMKARSFLTLRDPMMSACPRCSVRIWSIASILYFDETCLSAKYLLTPAMAHCLMGGCAAGLSTPIREKASTASISDRRRGEDASLGKFTRRLADCVGRGVDAEGVGRSVTGVWLGDFHALPDCVGRGIDVAGVRRGVDGLGREDNKVPRDADAGEGDGEDATAEDEGSVIFFAIFFAGVAERGTAGGTGAGQPAL
ncbi:hypothetical protein B0H14DRAFT_2564569 [Mycena olivaceomarginata]|nr:hypothetical protein B0H14DRAFT_2564569 [Mycena olivaceomarginata]